MQKQAIVIGLGQFGLSVARALAERRVDVLAIDNRPERIRAVADFVSEAACFDATDDALLAKTSPESRDVCLCAIGDDARESSIICTALLRQLGARRVIARANDDIHARILRLVGAHVVVNPEQEYGERFANQLRHESIKGELPLGEGLLITEVKAPRAFVGHPLLDLQLPRRFGVTVVAIREAAQSEPLLPDPARPIQDRDILVLVAKKGAVNQMLERS